MYDGAGRTRNKMGETERSREGGAVCVKVTVFASQENCLHLFHSSEV